MTTHGGVCQFEINNLQITRCLSVYTAQINRDMTFAKESMRAMLTDHYEWDNEYGIVWNKVQVRVSGMECRSFHNLTIKLQQRI